MTPRDYTRFATAAKSRFRSVAVELGFAQVSGILYVRERVGWYEVFNLQASRYGSDSFYVNIGIAVPQLCPAAEPLSIQDCGLLLSDRLQNTDQTGAYKSDTLAEITDSAERVKTQMKALAFPWFAKLCSWDAIAAEYYRVNPIEEDRIGTHSVVYGADFRSAIYGCLLYKSGRQADALRWLQEARRLLCLPVYFTRDGRTVHEPEHHARLQKPEPFEVKQLEMVEATLRLIAAGNTHSR